MGLFLPTYHPVPARQTEGQMKIAEIKQGDKLTSQGIPTHFEVVKVNRLTVRVRNIANGDTFSASPALFNGKAEEN